MNIEKIKPIPKYIEKLIYKKDLRYYKEQNGVTRYYAYLTTNDKELVKITVAVRNHKHKWYCKQVAVHGVHSAECFVKDMEFYYTSGYVTGWFDMGFMKYPKPYEDGKWYTAYDSGFDPSAILVNKSYVSKYPEYKYSAVELYNGVKIFKYLRLYEKYPQVEYLMKAGFNYYSFSIQLLRKISKDKQFRNWLLKHKDEITNNYYNILTILQAYQTNEELFIVQKYIDIYKRYCHDKVKSCICKVIKGKDWFKLEQYLKANKISEYTYADYIKACLSLNVDMTWSKNKYPHDFRHWHDIRTNEYELQKIALDEYKKKNFYRLFAEITNKYAELEKQDENYAIIIAKSPNDLKLEGQALNHCVGRMDYDKRVVDERSLIFFVRNVATIDTPLVTVEYSIKQRKVLQCYGYEDSKPEQQILDFVDKNWLPYANKQLRKIQRATA